jgi:hypothetical protein
MKKTNTFSIDTFVEKALDMISLKGERLGGAMGSMGRTAQRLVIGIGVLLIFGIAAFIWAVVNGMTKKEK